MTTTTAPDTTRIPGTDPLTLAFFRDTFRKRYEQYAEHNGRPFRVIERQSHATHPEKMDPESGHLWLIEFTDGDREQITAWPEEVEADTVALTGYSDRGNSDDYEYTLPGGYKMTVCKYEDGEEVAHVEDDHGKIVRAKRVSLDDPTAALALVPTLTSDQREQVEYWLEGDHDQTPDDDQPPWAAALSQHADAASRLAVPAVARAAEFLATNDELDNSHAVAVLAAASAILTAYRDATGRHALADLMLYEDLAGRDESETPEAFRGTYPAMLDVIARGLPAPSVLSPTGRGAEHFAQAEADAASEFMAAHGYTVPEFRCEGCGRDESACSVDPCKFVIEDRDIEDRDA